MYNLEKKVALITGSTSGIGEACAMALANVGVKVIVSGRNKDRGEKVVRAILEQGNDAIYIQLDVNDERSVNDCAEAIKLECGRLDILVNGAGIYPKFSSLENIKAEEIDVVMKTNYTSLVLLSSAFLQLLIETKGTIINIASVAGMQGFASGQGYAYASSKAAVIQFTKMMAKIYANKIRINCVCPGVIDTPLYFNLNKEKMSERIPVGRVGMANDVANVVRFLASEEAAYICGAAIPVDGGLTL